MTKLPVVTTRPGSADSSGASHPVNAKYPRWLVPNISSRPSRVLRSTR